MSNAGFSGAGVPQGFSGAGVPQGRAEKCKRGRGNYGHLDSLH